MQTKIHTIFDGADERMTGEEKYSVFSNDEKPYLSQETANAFIKIFGRYNLRKHFSCLEKAMIVAEALDREMVNIGSLFVDSTEAGVNYGYAYNPPLELHAWVIKEGYTIDFAIAGTIEKGLMMRDEIGYFLKDRTPVVVAGIPAPWMHYNTNEIIPVSQLGVMSDELVKEILKMEG